MFCGNLPLSVCAEPKEVPTSGSIKQLAGLGRAVGIWSRASGKLFNLEERIKDQVRSSDHATVLILDQCGIWFRTSGSSCSGLQERIEGQVGVSVSS